MKRSSIGKMAEDRKRSELGDREPISFLVCHTLGGNRGQTRLNTDAFFTAPFDCYIKSIWLTYTTAADASTLGVSVISDTEAKTAGTAVLTNEFDLTSVAKTAYELDLKRDRKDRRVKKGQRIAWDTGSDVANLMDLSITVELERMGRVSTKWPIEF